jgi:hypothetical protein
MLAIFAYPFGAPKRWWVSRKCMHHDWRTGETWIKSQLIDLGRRKMFWCSEKSGGCGKVWFT